MVSAKVLSFNGKRFSVEDGVQLWSISHVIYWGKNPSIEKSLNQNPYLATRTDHNCFILHKSGCDVGMYQGVSICGKWYSIVGCKCGCY